MEPRKYGTSASVCFTSNMRCGVWHGSSMSTLESTKLPTANVLLLNRPIVTRGAAADLKVVGARGVAAEDVAAFLIAVFAETVAASREAVTEVRAAGKCCGIGLHLQVPLVHVPVADVDDEQQQEEQRRHEDRCENQHAAALGRDWVR